MDLEAGQAIEWNDEAREALPDIFGIQVILNRVFQHLPNSKLLDFSLVSKLWKMEARMVIKKRGNVMALLKCDGTRGCGEVFQEFAENLQTLNETLYSGMTIWLHPVVGCCGIGALVVEAIHESILAGLKGQLKRLSIRLDYPDYCWNRAQNCPNFLLLRLLLTDFIMDLEHLTLEIEENMERLIQQFLPHGPYPRLKFLKLTWYTENLDNLIRTLISQAPNLKEIHTCGHVSLVENLLEGREGVVHVRDFYVPNPVHEISENVIPALRLKSIKLFFNRKPELELDRFNEKAQRLLRTCCATTLVELELEEVSLVLLMSYGIQLVNVKRLRIRLDYVDVELFEPRIISLLSHFDFTYLFPNLNKVYIWFSGMRNLGELSRDIMDAVVEQANNALPTEPTLPRAKNIKFLGLSQRSIPPPALQFFAQMFPAIQELDVNTQVKIFPVESAWKRWLNLQQIKVQEVRYQRP